MKRIGIIGGMSYEPTLLYYYYERINQLVNERAGGLVSADLVLRSVNFEEYYELMKTGNWNEISHKLSFEALDLVLRNECDYIAIAIDTMHKVADKVIEPHEVSDDGMISTSSWINIPLVHIGDCVAERCQKLNAKRVLLLGTKNFLSKRLESYGISIMDTSNYPEEIDEINRIIFDELCHGVVMSESKEFMMNFVYQFPCDRDERPDAVVLGCTELNMILEPNDVDIPLVDSTNEHIEKLVDLCLSD